AMPNQRSGLVRQRVSRPHDAEEHVEISAAVGDRTDIQGRIESADLSEERPPEGHVRAGSELSGAAVKCDGPVAGLIVHAVPAPLESAPEATVPFEQLLCARLQLE